MRKYSKRVYRATLTRATYPSTSTHDVQACSRALTMEPSHVRTPIGSSYRAVYSAVTRWPASGPKTNHPRGRRRTRRQRGGRPYFGRF